MGKKFKNNTTRTDEEENHKETRGQEIVSYTIEEAKKRIEQLRYSIDYCRLLLYKKERDNREIFGLDRAPVEIEGFVMKMQAKYEDEKSALEEAVEKAMTEVKCISVEVIE